MSHPPQPGHPQQGQPQQGYPPPGQSQPGSPQPGPPAPRKSSVPIVAVILATGLLLCGGVITGGVLIARNVASKAKEAVEPLTDLPTAVPQIPGLPTDLPDVPLDGTGRSITVTYEVSGDGPVQVFYARKLGDTPSRLDNVALPWRLTAKAETPMLASVTVVRSGADEGRVRCRALVDGQEVASRTTSSSLYATASCNHLVLE